ncbi:MAG: DHH family phosphoesterase [Pirellulaceae bacterium]
MSINWQEFKAVIDQSSNIVLTSHIRPDCDALGSELGMAGLLRQLGKRVRIVNGQETPPNLAFIDPQNEIMAIGKDIEPADLADADLLMILDTSAWAQLGPMGQVLRDFGGQKIIFDHHVGEDDLGATPFKNTTAEATGRLVVEAAEALGVELTAEMAMPLFAAVATDTGWYRFPSAGSLTYRIAAKLIDAGASPSGIFAALYERETLGRLRLRGLVLTRIETEIDGRLAHTYILKEDFTATGAMPTDTEDLVNHCLEIQGTEFAVILIEQAGGGFKVSFRSRCALNCNEVASEFGGGGHKAAAGAFIKGPFDEVQPRLLEHVRQSLKSVVAAGMSGG